MALLPARQGGRTMTTRTFPFHEVEDVYDRMGQLLNNVFGDLSRGIDDLAWSPQADIAETDDAYVLSIDVPGVRKDQIDVQVHERDIVVTGEVTRREDGRWFRRGRPAGRFDFRATMPGDVSPDKVSAELSDGVLTVRVPKAETAKPRKVEITA
jgi:HSP20 family protein